MNQNPKLYSVLCFRQNEEGKYESVMHYVAAFSSADAQKRIEAEGSEHLNGRRFIITDERMEYFNDRAAQFYVSSMTSDVMTEDTFNRWVKIAINNCDEEDIGPAYREF